MPVPWKKKKIIFTVDDNNPSHSLMLQISNTTLFNKLQSFQLKFSVSASAKFDSNIFKNTSGIFDYFGNGEKSKK